MKQNAEGASNKHRYFEKTKNGNDYWNFMHTLAAYYPESPSAHEQVQMDFFVRNSADYFLMEPRWIKRFHRGLKAMPPRVDSRNSFILWVCEQHNAVNESIGKSTFPCVLENLMKRWGPVSLSGSSKLA